MIDQKHSREPWYVVDGGMVGMRQNQVSMTARDGEFVALTVGRGNTEARSNAARIVTCVNACTGLTDPERDIEELHERAQYECSGCGEVKWWDQGQPSVIGAGRDSDDGLPEVFCPDCGREQLEAERKMGIPSCDDIRREREAAVQALLEAAKGTAGLLTAMKETFALPEDSHTAKAINDLQQAISSLEATQ
jgi:hypothetical protein